MYTHIIYIEIFAIISYIYVCVSMCLNQHIVAPKNSSEF